MKQYLLLLKSQDFNKSGNIWISNPINLYSNGNYRNYSYKRSRYGLNLLDNRIFVGTEVTSPSVSGVHSTPLTDGALYVTDYGEIVSDPATPNIFRFIDTTSRVDVLSYRHIFTNVPGNANPTFSLQLYESDSENGPWLRSTAVAESNAIFNRNCKQFIKIELEINDDGLEIENIGINFYLEIGIHDPSIGVSSKSSRDILRRFPSWTALYEDSVEGATPAIEAPKSTGGKFLNALVQEDLDDVEAKIDLYSINSFISTANVDQIAWCYVSNGVPANIISVYGDNAELARVGSYSELFQCRPADLVFYYSIIDRTITTLRKFSQLRVNNSNYPQEVVNVFNDFDEFGARVGLPRLYLESNQNFKKRILDVAINPPTASMDGFTRTVRRELDLWRAYGSTPDSNYMGATPLVLEISDIESSTPFVDGKGVPTRIFRTLVDDINNRFPSNWGYVRWGETVWDYGGLEQEGLGRLPAQYDVDDSVVESGHQTGVGDINDLKLEILGPDSATINFTGNVKLSGLVKDEPLVNYAPVLVEYQWYMSYLQQVSDYQSSLVRAGLVYEIDMPAHGSYESEKTFYVNLNHEDLDEFTVGNNYLASNPASPEYNLIKLFNQDGTAIVSFRDKEDDSFYVNTGTTPNLEAPNIYFANNLRLIFSKKWDTLSQAYENVTTDSYRATFNKATPSWITPSSGQTISMASPDFDINSSSILIGSNLYPVKKERKYSDTLSNSIVVNNSNDPDASSGNEIDIDNLTKDILLPPGVIKEKIYLDVVPPEFLTTFANENQVSIPGGVAFDNGSETNYVVPSSPNIIWSFDNQTYKQASITAATYSNITDRITYTTNSNHGFVTGNIITISGLSPEGYNRLYGEDIVVTSPTEFYISVDDSPGANSATVSSALAIESAGEISTYFESATINFSSTPNYISVETANGSEYPFLINQYNIFELETEPNTFSGIIDKDNNTYQSATLAAQRFKFYNSDKFLENITLNRESFGMDPDKEYSITNVEYSATPNSVLISTELNLVNAFNTAFAADESIIVPINAERYSESDVAYKLAIKPGWGYLNNQDLYMYYDPVVQTATGRFFVLPLTQSPKAGAPILVEVANNPYRNVVFEDSATPGQATFVNTEYLKAGFSDKLYLAYTDVENVTVIDNYTGKLVAEGLSSSSNEITPFTTVAKIQGREYKVTYKVRNAFYAEKDQFDKTTNVYSSQILFSSTPSVTSGYKVIYEGSSATDAKRLDLEVNQIDNPLSESFIYLSETDYEFSHIQAYLSPKFISDNTNDHMSLVIVSYDVNGNLKPGQTFLITGDLIESEDEYLTTDENGLARTILRYGGPIPAEEDESTISIVGVSANSPYGGTNSSSGSYSLNIPYNIVRNVEFKLELKAVPFRYNLNTGTNSKNTILGQVYWNGQPLEGQLQIKWNKARTMLDLFSESGTFVEGTTVTTDSNGRFEIVNAITVGSTNDPGYWLASVEIVSDEEVSALLAAKGETIGVDDITITGDIIYWHEEYDNIHFLNEYTPLPNVFEHVRQVDSPLTATPKFVYRHYDQRVVETIASTPNWIPPRWVPLTRYDQYQLGLLGDSPYVVSDYSSIHPDSKED